MRKTLSLILAVLVCVLFSVPSLLAKEPPKDAKAAVKAPATVLINAAAKKQPGVPFNHDQHTKLVKACDTCHHTNKGLTATSGTAVEKCSSCHLKAQGKMLTMADASLQKNPMHANCLGCHKEQKKGPTQCVKCHVKK